MTVTALPTSTDLGEALILNPDGTVTLRFGGAEWRLRRPTFGEYRQFLEADARIRADAEDTPEGRATAESIRDVIKTWQEEGELDADGLVTLAARLNAENVKAQMGTRSRNLAWWREVTAMLAGRPIPDDEACPLWLTNDAPAIQAIEHWLSVPTVAPGS